MKSTSYVYALFDIKKTTKVTANLFSYKNF